MEIKTLQSGALFDEAYKALNQEQKEAVDTIEGPVMVIAGPGTGKTQILTLRIANILRKTDIAPENILALTFTDSGVKAMRQRLRKYIGSRAYQVPIYTFHSFAQKCIAEYPDAYTRVIGGRPANDIEKIEIVESILESADIKLLRPKGAPEYYVKPILTIIHDMKREYITPDEFSKIIQKQEKELESIEKIHQKGVHKGKVRGEYSKKEKAIAKNKELLSVYRQYESLLEEYGLYDFEDMIIQTVYALSTNDDMLRDLQEQYQYVLADEHQDVNGSQNKILELICSYHDNPNIFVVGDEKQAIYRFQGASLENFLYFGDAFEGVKNISLTRNYRSGQVILDTAHSLIKVDDGPLKDLRVPLSAEVVTSSVVTQRCFSHQAVEDTWVLNSVKKAIEEGVAPGEIAIIVRKNKEVEAFAELFRKEGLPVHASADGDILNHPMTHTVRNLIEAVIADTNELPLFSVLHGSYWGISYNDLVKITSVRNKDTTLIQILSDIKKLKSLKLENPEAAHRVYTVLHEARKKESYEAPHRVLEFLLQESGFLNHILKHNMFEASRVVRRLYDEIEELLLQNKSARLKDVGMMFKKLQEYHLLLNAPYIATDSNAVQIMTAHKSKGLEFDTVFIPHSNDSIWGGGGRRVYFDVPITKHIDESKFDRMDDERRLFYVALTRTKNTLHLSCSDVNTDGKDLIPTRLFDDLDSKLLHIEDTSKLNKAFNPLDTLKYTDTSLKVDASLLTEILAERGFSATSLNNYLKNPWDYFYRNVLRIPQVQEMHMQFGTAVHNVLEKFTKHHTSSGKFLSDTEIKSLLEKELSKLPITNEEFVSLLQQGLEALYLYIEYIKPTLPKQTKEEFKVSVVLKTGIPELPELPLTGKLDRLDFDEKGNVYRVVDYKTGKPKTRNFIEGKTAQSDGGYKRQLVFYTLLLSLHDNKQYRCNTGVLSFVEADARGKIHEEVFTITDKEVDELRSEIITSAQEICSASFLNDPRIKAESDYCHLLELLQSGDSE